MWKPVDGFEGIYEVSDSGEIRSLDRDIFASNGVVYHRKGCMLKQTVCKGRVDDQNRQGYCVVNLRKPGTAKVCPVHVLVANAFIPNPENLPTVNHIDGDKLNNSVRNLEWASYTDNNVHALHNHLRNPRGNRIAQYTRDGSFVAMYSSACEAERRTGITHMNIFQCLHGRTKTAGGFVWKHVSEGQTTIPQGSTSEIDTDGSASHPTYEDEDIVCAGRNVG